MIDPEYISKIINNLDTSKTTQQGDSLTKVIKDNKYLFSSNQSVKKNQEMNIVCMINLKIVLIRYCQNNECGFRKGFSTQYFLLAMMEKLRKSLDSGRASAAFLTDLSKAFDCLPHNLLITKLHVYVFKFVIFLP